jgi:hypothetical protein
MAKRKDSKTRRSVNKQHVNDVLREIERAEQEARRDQIDAAKELRKQKVAVEALVTKGEASAADERFAAALAPAIEQAATAVEACADAENFFGQEGEVGKAAFDAIAALQALLQAVNAHPDERLTVNMINASLEVLYAAGTACQVVSLR